MDKKKARLRVGRLLDTCRDCSINPKSENGNYNISTEDREKACGACSIYAEMAQLRNVLDGKKVLPVSSQEVQNSEKVVPVVSQKVDNNEDTLSHTTRKKKVSKLALTVGEFVKLHYVDKKTASEIGKLCGVDRKVIGNWKWRHKEEINKMLAEKGLTEADAADERGKHRKKLDNANVPAPSPAVDWKAKYEEAKELIEGQKIEIKDLLTKIERLQAEQKETQAADLHAACEDIENELADIRKENDMLREENARFIEQSHKYRVELEKEQQRSNLFLTDYNSLVDENKHLRGLVKLWL